MGMVLYHARGDQSSCRFIIAATYFIASSGLRRILFDGSIGLDRAGHLELN